MCDHLIFYQADENYNNSILNFWCVFFSTLRINNYYHISLL